jgi:hypothetical protein
MSIQSAHSTVSQRVSEKSKGYNVFVLLLLGVADLCRDIIRLFRVQSVPLFHPKPTHLPFW